MKTARQPDDRPTPGRRFRAAARMRGMALIIVMVAVFVLTVIAGAFAYSMKVEMRLAQTANNEAELVWLGRSGVELASWVLSEQMKMTSEPYDALNQKWAGGPGGLSDSNSPLAFISLEDYPIGNGKVTVKIIDLDRKFNLNSVAESVLQQALGVMGVEASEAAMVASSILDWIDNDEQTRINGTESDYYQSLDPPYFSKNKPMDDLSELQFIRGVTPELYWGNGVARHRPASFQTLDRYGQLDEEPVYPVGLTDVFTPLSSGRININTASATVLTILFAGDQAAAEQIIKLRSGPDGVEGTEDDTPVGSPGFRAEDFLRSAGVALTSIQEAARWITTRSSVFEVEVHAQIGGSTRTFHAIVSRNPQNRVEVLSFYWKERSSAVPAPEHAMR